MIGRLCIYVIGILCLAHALFATVGGGYSYTDFYYDPITHELIYVWNDESEAGRVPVIKHQAIDNETKNDKVLGLYERLKQSVPSEIDYDNCDQWEQTRSEICEKYGVKLQSVDLARYGFQYYAIESWGKSMTFDNLNTFISKYTEEEIKEGRMSDTFNEGQRFFTSGTITDNILKTVIKINITNRENKVSTFSIPAIMGFDHVILKGLSYPEASFLVIVVRAYFTGDEGGYMGDSVCIVKDIKIPTNSFVKEVKGTEIKISNDNPNYVVNDIRIQSDSSVKEVQETIVKISNANINKMKLSQLFDRVGREQYQKQRYYAALYFYEWAYGVDNSNLRAKSMCDQIIKRQSNR